MSACKALIIGGGGYLGQFVLDRLLQSASDWECYYTFHGGGPLSLPLPLSPSPPRGFHVDLASGDGLAACLSGKCSA